MDLSVVIVSYNVKDYLRGALLSVIRASQALAHEIIVVDNNSSDGSVSMISGEFPEVRLIVSENNEGFAAACNRGIKASKGDYILILNPDTIVSNDALVNALSFMRSHPEAGAAGARMTDEKGNFLPESKRGFPSPLTSFFRLSGLGRVFKRSAFLNSYYLGNKPDNQICKADILTGAFMFVNRRALDAAGLFDTSFFMYGEDIDLSWRIRKAGFINYYLPASRITHFKGRSAPANDPERIRHFYGAMNIFAVKHLHRRWHMPVRTAVFCLTACALLTARLRYGRQSTVIKKA